ncbi:ArsR family transcriptional regulator [[Flexibacter] sp. ATCC 35103]|uniref:ArsR family transcriptional regulator n=1 Tax=[Flexibacter] sp. ATCC 35103 TaxID=1937528 RepID=UPI0009CEA3CB|nr:ArsR family transcriptional regulator [[Flexibacter] sp. ATCC 35103]OMQ11737.1 ArsR family transcriptional regulator [[Flexibacter] sp. ATCC 35103]
MNEKSNTRKPAKMCYEHIGGKLGQLLLENFADKGWIAKNKPTDKNFYITDLGQKEFVKLGIDVSQIKSEVL